MEPMEPMEPPADSSSGAPAATATSSAGSVSATSSLHALALRWRSNPFWWQPHLELLPLPVPATHTALPLASTAVGFIVAPSAVELSAAQPTSIATTVPTKFIVRLPRLPKYTNSSRALWHCVAWEDGGGGTGTTGAWVLRGRLRGVEPTYVRCGHTRYSRAFAVVYGTLPRPPTSPVPPSPPSSPSPSAGAAGGQNGSTVPTEDGGDGSVAAVAICVAGALGCVALVAVGCSVFAHALAWRRLAGHKKSNARRKAVFHNYLVSGCAEFDHRSLTTSGAGALHRCRRGAVFRLRAAWCPLAVGGCGYRRVLSLPHHSVRSHSLASHLRDRLKQLALTPASPCACCSPS